jgi:hypothetical protein
MHFFTYKLASLTKRAEKEQLPQQGTRQKIYRM